MYKKSFRLSVYLGLFLLLLAAGSCASPQPGIKYVPLPDTNEKSSTPPAEVQATLTPNTPNIRQETLEATPVNLPTLEEISVVNAPSLQLLDNLAAFSAEISIVPDGKILASASLSGKIYLWNLENGELLQTITLPRGAGTIWTVQFSADGSLLAAGSGDGIIRVFKNDPENKEQAWVQTFSLEKHINEIRCLAFSPDGSSLVSGANDQMIYRWDPASGEFLNEIGRNPGFVRSLVFSPSIKALASASGAGTLRLWNPDGKILKENIPFEDYFTGLAFSPDGSLLVGSAENSYLWFFDGETLERLAYIKAHEGDINSVAFSPDGSLLASGSDDKTLKVWQVNRSEKTVELVLLTALQMEKDYSVYDVLFSPDGKMLISSSVNGPVLLWGIPN